MHCLTFVKTINMLNEKKKDEFKVKSVSNTLSERPELWAVCQRSELKTKVCEIFKLGVWIGDHLSPTELKLSNGILLVHSRLENNC